MTVQLKTRWATAEEYLALERESETRSEFYRGEIRPMTGASRKHNLIAGSVLASLYGQLRRRPCEVYPGDMRVKVSAAGLYTYPDVVVVCGEPQLEDKELDTLLNPTVIIEVLSDSTASYDRGEKFEHYRALDSLADYLLISQDEHLVVHYVRQADNTWLSSESSAPEDRIRIASIRYELVIEDIYEKVDSVT